MTFWGIKKETNRKGKFCMEISVQNSSMFSEEVKI